MVNTSLKKEKGIALVALVITIIVLIILAGVAIATLSRRDNVITKAKEARDVYNTEQGKEEETLDSYNEVVEQSLGKGGGSITINQLVGKVYREIPNGMTIKINNDGSWDAGAASGDAIAFEGGVLVAKNQGQEVISLTVEQVNGSTVLLGGGMVLSTGELTAKSFNEEKTYSYPRRQCYI